MAELIDLALYALLFLLPTAMFFRTIRDQMKGIYKGVILFRLPFVPRLKKIKITKKKSRRLFHYTILINVLLVATSLQWLLNSYVNVFLRSHNIIRYLIPQHEVIAVVMVGSLIWVALYYKERPEDPRIAERPD